MLSGGQTTREKNGSVKAREATVSMVEGNGGCMVSVKAPELTGENREL